MTVHRPFPGAEWLAEVHRTMAEIGREFSSADMQRQRDLAGAAVAQITLALADVGVFEGDASGAQDALQNLLKMIRDLEHGRRHPWSIPTNFGGTRIEQQGDREVRLWAILATELLLQSGTKPEAAYQQVAAKLKAAKHRFTSAKKWHTSYKKDRRPADVERVEGALADRRDRFSDAGESARNFLRDPEGVLPWLVALS